MKHRSIPATWGRFVPPAVVFLVATFLFVNNIIRASPAPLGTFVANDPSAPVDFRRRPALNPSEKHLHRGSKAMVSSDVPECSEMGKNILLAGGNAADAAVTVALCIGSVNAYSAGIGGGGYITSSSALTGEVLSIDAREMAPADSYESMFEHNPYLSVWGGLSNAVPGELKGLDELFHRHGSGNLTWKQVIEPVIEMNRLGFECPDLLSYAFNRTLNERLNMLPSLAKEWDFLFKQDGRIKEAGDLIFRPNLASTLELIANNGSSDIFYDPEGPIAKPLIRTNRRFGGIFRPVDFKNYHVNVEKAVSMKFKDDFEIFSSKGVSSGLILLSGINLFDELYNKDDSDVITTHKIIETMKWMASVRSRLGDIPKQAYDDLFDKYTAKNWTKSIIDDGKYSDNRTFPWQHYDPLYELTNPKGTSHFSILDENNNAVSMTTTINLGFGSLVYDRRTGIILNDEMDDFSTKTYNNSFNLAPSKFNHVAPGKRPLSSTCPAIIMRDGVPEMLIGAAGGSRITTAVFHAIIRSLYFETDLLPTIAYPRIHEQLIPDYTMVEDFKLFNEEHGSYGILHKLEALGHKFKETGAETTMNAIKKVHRGDGIELEGVSDFWRKNGEADGY